MRVVVDGGNGMAGPMVGPLLHRLGLDLVESLLRARTGASPTTSPTRCCPRTASSSCARSCARTADLGIAWDGDADRCFFIDDQGAFVDGDFLTALLAESMFEKNPGATILYDVRASWAVKDVAEKAGGRALMNRVGHAFFKTRMREEHAVFGGEVSGHYYFHDFYCADSGTIPALLILELLSHARQADVRAARALPLDATSSPARSTPRSPTERPRSRSWPRSTQDGNQYRLDGLSVEYDDWHFNVRPSNTEPLLRLCLESLRSREDMERRRDEVLAVIRS